MNITIDPKVEQILRKESYITWHLEEDVPLSNIDREASLKNQARFQALDHEHVIELAIDVAEGARFPALVVFRNNKQMAIIMDGNHRSESYIMANNDFGYNITKTDLVVIDNPNPWIIDLLTRTLNRGTLPIGRDERIEHAKYLISKHNITQAEAERREGLPPSTIAKYVQADSIRERLSKLGFQENLPLRHLGDIYRIKQDKALLETANLIVEAKLDINETAEVSRRVHAASASEKQQLNELAKIRDEYKDRIVRVKHGQIRKQLTPILKWRKGLSDLLAVREESIIPLDSELKHRSREANKKIERVLNASQ